MWFSKQPRNRRLARVHVLDVKLRSGQARRARLRLAARAVGAVLGTLLVVFVALRTAEWGLKRLVYENKAFAIRTLDVRTDGSIVREQLQRWAGVQLGQNLMALDLARVQRDLELEPVIQSASVERIPPHTLKIRVIEREAVARLAVPTRTASGGIEITLLDLDGDGWVMPPLDPRLRRLQSRETPPPLPLLTNVYPGDVRIGSRIASPQVQAALRLLSCFEHSPMVDLADLRTIDVSASQVLVVNTGQGSVITLPLDDFERQLMRWRLIYDLGQQNNKMLASLDLAITDSVPALWLEASAVPQTPARVNHPVHFKKKHV
jgi:cell division septal protein FtsQ